MTDQYSLSQIIKADSPEEWAERLSYVLECMIGTARLALDNETVAGEQAARRLHMVEHTLEVAQALAGVVTEGCDMLARRRERQAPEGGQVMKENFITAIHEAFADNMSPALAEIVATIEPMDNDQFDEAVDQLAEGLRSRGLLDTQKEGGK